MRGGCAALCPAIAALVITATTACEREARPFRDLPAAAARSQPVTLTPLRPGDVPPPETGQKSPFQENAYGIAEGKRLYESFNCVGCHAHGGGGMGPPLMDARWIYGSAPANIFEAIVEGRPNGMPSFRNKIADRQVWQIVAYVQALSGNAPMAALPGRSDHMRYSTPENARRAASPRQTGSR